VRCRGQGAGRECGVFFFQAEDGIRDFHVTGVQTCALPISEKDLADIKTAAEIDVDYLAVSFPRSADDMNYARSLMEAAGGKAGLVAKVERAEAVADDAVLDDIIRASDAVMVARGDLGVEIGDAALIGVQKRIIERSRALNKV